MPFVQVYLSKNFSGPTKKSISIAIQESLIKVFHVPEDDYFQVFQQLAEGNLIYPKSYLGIRHSPDLLYILIHCGPGRTGEMKKALFHCIAEHISNKTAISKEDIIIILSETEVINWSFGMGLAQMA